MKEEQKSIVIYKSWKKPLRKLSLEQKGRFFDALLDFPDSPNFSDDQKLEMAWDFVSDVLESNAQKWGVTREKRSAAGRKGAESTNGKRQQNAANPANADFAEQKQQNAANPAVNVNGNVNVNVNDNVISPNGDVYNSAAVDMELSKIVQHYQQTIGDFPRSALDKMQKWRQEYSTEMILLAIDKAAEAGKRSWNYINGILSGWQRDGIQTPGDVSANEQNRQNRTSRKQPPETVDDQLARVLAKMDRERGFET